jgi:hypothetical protein
LDRIPASTTALHAISNLKVPDDTPANEQIVLSALVRGNIQFWDDGPEVSEFTPQAELTVEGHVQARADLEDTGSGSRSWLELNIASAEVAETAALI